MLSPNWRKPTAPWSLTHKENPEAVKCNPLEI